MCSVPSLEPKEDQDGCQQTEGRQCKKGAVNKRSQTKTTIGGAAGYTKRDRSSGEFMAVKKPTKAKKAAKKFKGVRMEKKAAGKKTAR